MRQVTRPCFFILCVSSGSVAGCGGGLLQPVSAPRVRHLENLTQRLPPATHHLPTTRCWPPPPPPQVDVLVHSRKEEWDREQYRLRERLAEADAKLAALRKEYKRKKDESSRHRRRIDLLELGTRGQAERHGAQVAALQAEVETLKRVSQEAVRASETSAHAYHDATTQLKELESEASVKQRAARFGQTAAKPHRGREPRRTHAPRSHTRARSGVAKLTKTIATRTTPKAPS